MSLITDPYTSLKNHALKIWDTKDFANRLAFTNMVWVLVIMWGFFFVTTLHLFLSIVIGDLLTLAVFYNNAWYLEFTQNLFYETTFIQIGIIFFIVCPKLVRLELIIYRAYLNKEKGFYSWLETKIKLRFPNYKTSTERARERAEKPVQKPKVAQWINKRPPFERRLIRMGIWIGWAIIMTFSLTTIFGNAFDDDFSIWRFMTGEEVEKVEPTAQEKQEILDKLAELEREVPKIPDGRPPPTIYDIFINKPDTVIP